MKPEQVEEAYVACQQKARLAGKNHPLVKRALGIIQNTKPNPEKLCVIEGLWALEKALHANVEIQALFFCPDLIHSQQAKEMVTHYVAQAQTAYLLSEKMFLRLSEKDGPDGLLAMVRLNFTTLDALPLRRDNLLVIVDGVEIPGNIGTILRTIDGVKGDGLIVCNRRARIPHPKVIKASQGTCFTVPIVEIEEEAEVLMRWLRNQGFTIFLADTDAQKHYYEFAYSGRIALVVGSERYGITKQWYDVPHEKIRIPMLGNSADSLNVAIAATVILYEMSLTQQGLLKRTA